MSTFNMCAFPEGSTGDPAVGVQPKNPMEADSTVTTPEEKALLKFQIGPVQEFIAAARSTRDLWSGSYLLSFIVAAGIRRLRSEGGELVFPYADPEKQPLISDPETWHRLTDQSALLTPNLPNLFVAVVPASGAAELARGVKEALIKQWRAIAESVWKDHRDFGIRDAAEAVFYNQIDKHLSIAWQITPLGDDYRAAYATNGKHLDAVRQTRDFHAWGTGHWDIGGEKDSLTGKEESLLGGDSTKNRVARQFQHLFKHDDHVGAITLIKRVWHLTYLTDVLKLKAGSRAFPIRSIPAIAARTDRLDDDELPQEKTVGERYVAAIAFDGDSIGKWISGELLPDGGDLKTHHGKFSAVLSRFALEHVRSIMAEQVDGTNSAGEPIKVPVGQLIYAGGDDVVALVPADKAIDVARRLRDAFRAATMNIAGIGVDAEGNPGPVTPDASVGIAIAHIHAPLQDLIRAAQTAEKRAKNLVRRPAFSVTLLKRSGEITEWGSRWKSGGIELYHKIAELLNAGKLSARFPHRICELLEHYVNHGQIRDSSDFDAAAVVVEEFAGAVSRQSARGSAEENAKDLAPLLKAYVGKLGPEPQRLLGDVISLCATVAFAHRTQPVSKPFEGKIVT